MARALATEIGATYATLDDPDLRDVAQADPPTSGIDRGTAQSYLPWLETVFLVHRVPAWRRNLTAKVVKRPKIYLTEERLYHFRDSDGAEVDLVLEADDGRVLGVEVKASSTPRSDDFRWLARMRDRLDQAGGHFTGGIVLHTGQRQLPFGDRPMALPASDLWS